MFSMCKELSESLGKTLKNSKFQVLFFSNVSMLLWSNSMLPWCNSMLLCGLRLGISLIFDVYWSATARKMTNFGFTLLEDRVLNKGAWNAAPLKT